MTTPPPKSRDETARLGKELYERNIRHLVENDHHGEVVAIDVGSGSYAVGEMPLPHPRACGNTTLTPTSG